MKLIRILGLSVLAAVSAAAQTAETPFPPEKLNEIVAQLSEITGLEQRHEVAQESISREQLRQYLERKVNEEVDPKEIHIQEILLKMFGFAPADFDLRQTTIDLYSEQAAAFYDFDQKKLFMLEGNGSMVDEAAVIHELAHALADQHFPLRRFLEQVSKNDDASLARMAVMEGQATWLMAEVMANRMGMSLIDQPAMVDLMSRMVTASTGEFPVLDSAPLYLRESLLFPYNFGMKFQNAVVAAKGKEGFSQVFQDPPASTRNILQPESYLAGEKPAKVAEPRLRRQGPYKSLAEGTVGEFDYSVLLNQYIGEDAVLAIAPNWRGGRYRLLEHKKDGHTVLLHTSVWASEEVARDFFERYREVLKSKWETMEVSDESPDTVRGTGDDGHFLIELRGAEVRVAEGVQDDSVLPIETPGG